MKDYVKGVDSSGTKAIVEASASDYMNDDQLEVFKNCLIELHNTTRERIRDTKQQLLSPPDLSDLSDRASWEEQCAILMRIVDREQKLLPKIHQSLQRIRSGEYGYCLETGEPIGIERLLARPTAEFCTDVKQCQELKEHVFIKRRNF
jgi:DnaK suppressor protein